MNTEPRILCGDEQKRGFQRLLRSRVWFGACRERCVQNEFNGDQLINDNVRFGPPNGPPALQVGHLEQDLLQLRLHLNTHTQAGHHCYFCLRSFVQGVKNKGNPVKTRPLFW